MPLGKDGKLGICNIFGRKKTSYDSLDEGKLSTIYT